MKHTYRPAAASCLTAAFFFAACLAAPAPAQAATTPTASSTTTAAPAAYIAAPATRYPLSNEERATVERVVMAEAGHGSSELQEAVALCILNTAEATGQRPDEVATAPGQYADPWEGDINPSVKTAVSAVFDDGANPIAAPVQYFYAPRWMPGGTSDWHETLTFVTEIDGVRFFTAEASK